MNVVTIDIESHYDRDFSLSKMTTEEYIRDPRFQIIGASIKENDGPSVWYPGNEAIRVIQSTDYSQHAILCHNTLFDGAILSWRYNVRPKLWLDTLSMARPKHLGTTGCSLAVLAKHYGLPDKGTEVVAAMGKRLEDFTPQELAQYGRYCCNDADITWALWNILRKGFPATELLAIDNTLRMYIEPNIELDVPLLEEHLERVRAKKTELLAQAGIDITTIMSNPKFADALRALGVEPPTKTSVKTGKVAFAFSKTDKGLTELLDHEDVRVQTLVATRLGVKSTIEETRTQGLIEVGSRGRLPVALQYYGAHTGRFSGSEKLNLQNLPSRGGNTTLRQALRAPAGCVFVGCDSSQIEARIVSWLAGQEDLVSAFRDARDVYSEFATEVYGRPITKADKQERFVGKVAVLSLGYGAGAPKFREMLRTEGGVVVDEDEAQRVVTLYRRKYPAIPRLWRTCGLALQGMVLGRSGEIHPQLPYSTRGIKLPSGFYLPYNELQQIDGEFRYISDAREYRKFKAGDATAKWKKIYGGAMTENICQALAAIIIREQLVSIGRQYKTVLQVHDEIVVVVPANEADAAAKSVAQIMATAPKWAPGLPLACEFGISETYGGT
jgi:DNA polymerase